jgi:hypothetical protein
MGKVFVNRNINLLDNNASHCIMSKDLDKNILKNNYRVI